jgi:hypothetical protein
MSSFDLSLSPCDDVTTTPTRCGRRSDFAALGFGAQSIIAPLGSLTLVANIGFARLLLGETITWAQLFATAWVVVGSALCVAFASHSNRVYEYVPLCRCRCRGHSLHITRLTRCVCGAHAIDWANCSDSIDRYARARTCRANFDFYFFSIFMDLFMVCFVFSIALI